MGGAVIFVITLSSFVTSVIYQFILVPTHMEYLQTIVFILIIAALVQFVDMFLKKAMPSLYQALGVYLPLITTNCAVLGLSLIHICYSINIVTVQIGMLPPGILAYICKAPGTFRAKCHHRRSDGS